MQKENNLIKGKIMDKEIKIEEFAFLVSEISKEGLIRFASDDFCKISGYSLDELFGKPLKMIYHHDMPDEILSELWETIEKGETWVGYLKNLTKEGDYFWTYTNIYPFESSDGSTGYLSCRKKASNEEIKNYTREYEEMKNKSHQQ